MKMKPEEYQKLADSHAPKSHHGKNMLKAFLIGGGICTVGQGILNAWTAAGLDKDSAGCAASASMIFLGALLTGMGVYDRLARHGGAGTLVPITGFANAIVSAALEFKSEGYIVGMAAKMFVIAGPVLVFGISASVFYGLFLRLFGLA